MSDQETNKMIENMERVIESPAQPENELQFNPKYAKNGYQRETTAATVSKEIIGSSDYTEDYINFVMKQLGNGLADRIYNIIEHYGDIIIKRPEFEVSDFPSIHSYEYRKTLSWRPLVRCKDCKSHGDCCIERMANDPDTFFCAAGRLEYE